MMPGIELTTQHNPWKETLLHPNCYASQRLEAATICFQTKNQCIPSYRQTKNCQRILPKKQRVQKCCPLEKAGEPCAKRQRGRKLEDVGPRATTTETCSPAEDMFSPKKPIPSCLRTFYSVKTVPTSLPVVLGKSVLDSAPASP